jgi:imidazole glycerol-phosphate synthase subunit HisH
MGNPKVVIIDYGVGNLLSVQRAVEECGAEAITSSEPDVIVQADRVILPGVGAFANGMQALVSRGLVEVIKAIAEDSIPLLGICLGMQLLLDESEEHGVTKGLGIIPGRVVPVPAFGIDGTSVKIPHIGWNSLVASENATWNGTIVQNSTPGDAVYFVHSFMSVPEDPAMRIADCLYGGNRIPAVIGKDNVVGCQFHPEKSGETGIRILENFCVFERAFGVE